MAEHCTLTSVSSCVALFSHCLIQRWCWDWAIPSQAFITVTPRWPLTGDLSWCYHEHRFHHHAAKLVGPKLYRIADGFLCRVGYALFLSRMPKSTVSCLSLKSTRVSLLSPLSSFCHWSRITRHCPCKRLPLMLFHLLWNGWPFLSRLLVKADTINTYFIDSFYIVLCCIVNKTFICSLVIWLVFICLWIWRYVYVWDDDMICRVVAKMLTRCLTSFFLS
jgi:hypothetical protein